MAEAAVMTLLHASDLHFGKHFHPLAAEALVRAAGRLAPDLVVVSGDLTQRAKVREYEQASDYLRRFAPTPLVVVPGNHDVPLYRVLERLLDPYRNYRAYVSPDLDTVTRIPGAVVVGLSSAAPRSAIVNGRVRAHQVERAAAAFGDAGPDDARIVVVHHPLTTVPDEEGGPAMRGASDLLEALARVGVELVLGGHGHRSWVARAQDVRPGTSPGPLLVLTGTTTSWRGRAREHRRNSLNLVRLDARRIEVVRHLYDETTREFAPEALYAFPRDGARMQWEGSAVAVEAASDGGAP